MRGDDGKFKKSEVKKSISWARISSHPPPLSLSLTLPSDSDSPSVSDGPPPAADCDLFTQGSSDNRSDQTHTSHTADTPGPLRPVLVQRPDDWVYLIRAECHGVPWPVVISPSIYFDVIWLPRLLEIIKINYQPNIFHYIKYYVRGYLFQNKF